MVAHEILTAASRRVTDTGSPAAADELAIDAGALWLMWETGQNSYGSVLGALPGGLGAVRRLAEVQRTEGLVTDYLGRHPSTEARAAAAKDVIIEATKGTDYKTQPSVLGVVIPVKYFRQNADQMAGDARSGLAVLKTAVAYSRNTEVRDYGIPGFGPSSGLSGSSDLTADQMVKLLRTKEWIYSAAKAQWSSRDASAAVDTTDPCTSVLTADKVWDMTRLSKELQAQRPVILQVNAGKLRSRTYSYSGLHFILVVGCKATNLICHDPSVGRPGTVYTLAEVEEAMKGIAYPVIYGFPVPQALNPERLVCEVSGKLVGNYCNSVKRVPALPSKLPKEICDVCKPPVTTSSEPVVVEREPPTPTRVIVRPPDYVSTKASEPPLPAQRPIEDSKEKGREMVIIDEASFHLADLMVGSTVLYLKEFVLTKADLAGRTSAKLQVSYRTKYDKAPVVSINRTKIGDLTGTPEEWTDCTINVDLLKLHPGKNLLDIETAKPCMGADRDNCELREVLLLLN